MATLEMASRNGGLAVITAPIPLCGPRTFAKPSPAGRIVIPLAFKTIPPHDSDFILHGVYIKIRK
jgi:hypothetical protein